MITRLRSWLRTPEHIGAPDCPIMNRWTIVDEKPAATASHGQKVMSLLPLPKWLTRDYKLMVHHFLPNVEDRDPHDHPRPFWTLVLKGCYFDLVPCPECDGVGTWTEYTSPEEAGHGPCPRCRGDKVVVGDVMRRGMVRYRPAEHTHLTQTSRAGAWTVVVMCPLARPWGFWRSGKWWAWRDYEKEFGFAMRCPSDDELEGAMLKYDATMV
jgi:hypothetical protein